MDCGSGACGFDSLMPFVPPEMIIVLAFLAASGSLVDEKSSSK